MQSYLQKNYNELQIFFILEQSYQKSHENWYCGTKCDKSLLLFNPSDSCNGENSLYQNQYREAWAPNTKRFQNFSFFIIPVIIWQRYVLSQLCSCHEFSLSMVLLWDVLIV